MTSHTPNRHRLIRPELQRLTMAKPTGQQTRFRGSKFPAVTAELLVDELCLAAVSRALGQGRRV